jgi:hypothetical protein
MAAKKSGGGREEDGDCELQGNYFKHGPGNGLR